MLMLDTHAFVWLASDQSHLTEAGKAAVREHAGALCISSITGMEIALLHKRKRLDLPVAPAVFVARAMDIHGVQQLPVSVEIGCRAAVLPDIHNDPFDRIIIASCLAGGHILLSRDRIIPTYGMIKVIW